MEDEQGAQGNILQELELGRQEEVEAEEYLVDDEAPEVQQGLYRTEQLEGEQGPAGGLMSVEQFVLEGDNFMQVVQIVGETEVSVTRENILWKLELWREEVVTEGQLLVEVEFVVEQGAERGQQWQEDGLEVEVVLEEEIFQELGLGRQEEVQAEDLLVEEKEEHDVLQTEDRERHSHYEERMHGQLVAGEEFVLHEEGPTQEEHEVKELEDESLAEAKEQGEQSVKEEPEGPGQGTFTRSSVEALRELQSEMEPVNEQAIRAFSQLKYRAWQRRKPHLELRSTIIQRMRGFWAKAFVNHPELSAMISDQDKIMLSFMIDLKVEKSSDRCKIMLLFRNNPYFRNDVVVKEYLLTLTGHRASYSTPIQWHKRYAREAYTRRHNNSSLNFFNWFSEHSLAGAGRIAECICNDLWPNPLKYYVRKMAAGEGAEKGTAIFSILMGALCPLPARTLVIVERSWRKVLNTWVEDIQEVPVQTRCSSVSRGQHLYERLYSGQSGCDSAMLCCVAGNSRKLKSVRRSPFHLKDCFTEKASSEEMGFQANTFLPHRK